MLKYAHEKGCPWDELTCQYAARGGYLCVLKYAHENGCPWNERTAFEAARGGHVEVLNYVTENSVFSIGAETLADTQNRKLEFFKMFFIKHTRFFETEVNRMSLETL